jgi:endonuclease YncB( thermonuclease family)
MWLAIRRFLDLAILLSSNGIVADRSRQAMVVCTMVSVGSLGAAMVVSGLAVVIVHLASARAYDPYRDSEKES